MDSLKTHQLLPCCTCSVAKFIVIGFLHEQEMCFSSSVIFVCLERRHRKIPASCGRLLVFSVVLVCFCLFCVWVIHFQTVVSQTPVPALSRLCFLCFYYILYSKLYWLEFVSWCSDLLHRLHVSFLFWLHLLQIWEKLAEHVLCQVSFCRQTYFAYLDLCRFWKRWVHNFFLIWQIVCRSVM